MSGHSKWSSIKHKKAAVDARRGKEFSKLIRFIEVAAREGGADPDMNPTLATAVTKARAASMPTDNINRAINRGTGDLEGVSYEEIHYEGYGPGGVAIYVAVLTDNRNRAAAEVRSVFSKNGGSLGEPGSVSWKFDKKGVIIVPKDKVDEDTLLELALDAGAEDVTSDESSYEVKTEPSGLAAVRQALEDAGVEFESADVTMLPQSTVSLDESRAVQVMRIVERLEDLDDVQDVYSDFDISEEILAKLA